MAHEATISQVVGCLSLLIVNSLQAMEEERHFPGHDPDHMDEKIKRSRERAAILRRLREEFENEMAKPI